MNYSVLSIPPFDNQLKRLAKKYPSLKQDFANLLESLETKPEQGIPIGKSCFKIRLAIKSKGKGKRGGARVITNYIVYVLHYVIKLINIHTFEPVVFP